MKTKMDREQKNRRILTSFELSRCFSSKEEAQSFLNQERADAALDQDKLVDIEFVQQVLDGIDLSWPNFRALYGYRW